MPEEDLSFVTFAEGGELRFTEEATRERDENYFLLRSSFRKPFCTIMGTLPRGIELRGAYGVMERHDAVW